MGVWSYLCCSTRDDPTTGTQMRVSPRNVSLTQQHFSTSGPANDKPKESVNESDPMVVNGVAEDDPSLLWPHTLHVTCPRCIRFAGTYRLNEVVTVNDMPLWEKEGDQLWVFHGIGGQWLIGDEHEYKADFKCDTGNIASYEPAEGRLPDEIGPGGWLHYIDDEWFPDPEINITSDLYTSEDQAEHFERARRETSAAMKIQSRYRGLKVRKQKKMLVSPKD
eukprot:TRINITY_DN68396_c0_g1_i1.p1 TRINITY_DN68396_c0_g1~~TRINITY_DN68396_c0_g1_i1.p1  ORF type:complete len:221 (+),score=14.55 TRINITY_DN68396_c0_g1_i1:116-778(+)